MLIPSENGLDCIEEVSSSASSSDGAEWLQKHDLARLSSDLNLSTTNTECVNLQNSSINIDNSSDVVIGSIAHFHGPVTIVQNPSENAPVVGRDGEKNKVEGRCGVLNLEFVYVFSVVRRYVIIVPV